MVMLSCLTRITFRVLSLTVSTTLPIALAILLVRLLSIVWASSLLSLGTNKQSILLTVNLRSVCSSLTSAFGLSVLTLSLKLISGSKSSKGIRNLLFCCLFFRVETVFVLTIRFYLSYLRPIELPTINRTINQDLIL